MTTFEMVRKGRQHDALSLRNSTLTVVTLKRVSTLSVILLIRFTAFTQGFDGENLVSASISEFPGTGVKTLTISLDDSKLGKHTIATCEYDTFGRISYYQSIDTNVRYIYIPNGVSKVTTLHGKFARQEAILLHNNVELHYITLVPPDTLTGFSKSILQLFKKIIDTTQTRSNEVLKKIKILNPKGKRPALITIVKNEVIEGRISKEFAFGHNRYSIVWHYQGALLKQKTHFDAKGLRTKVEHFDNDGNLIVEQFFGGPFHQHDSKISYTTNNQPRLVVTTKNGEQIQILELIYDSSGAFLVEAKLVNVLDCKLNKRKLYSYSFWDN